MSTTGLHPSAAARRWHDLARRHLRMATLLLRRGFADGAMFHAFHAFECGMSALIAAHGRPVPTDHRGRFTRFEQMRESAQPYASTAQRLTRLTVAARNDALYYDQITGLLPTDIYTTNDVDADLRLVARFVFELRREIP